MYKLDFNTILKLAESSSESGESVQSEPLSLVTCRNPRPPHQAPILYQQLSTSSVTSSLNSPPSFAPPIPPLNVTTQWSRPSPESFMMRPDYLMLYPGRMPNPFIMQHFAALHAEYVRSLYAINNHHFA